MKSDPLVMLNVIAQTIFDKKGTNILALDVRRISSITDYVIIAEGTVDRHVKAIAQAIRSSLKGQASGRVEGEQEGDWVVLDFGNVMVHLFAPRVRDLYQLEDLFKAGEIVDLKIEVG